MDNECRNCDDKQACIPFFAHESGMTHLSMSNRRLLIALLAVCLTFILTIIIFVKGYTEREKNWLDKLSPRIVEVDDGIHEQPDP